VLKVNEEDRFLVMASDGLWDWMDKREVADVCLGDNKNP